MSTEDRKQKSRPAGPGVRQRYQRPQLTRLGSLLELTLKGGAALDSIPGLTISK
jgi:hypothetical protein